MEEQKAQLEKQRREAAADLVVERSERSRLGELVTKLKSEVSQVTDRLNREVVQNTELRVRLRQVEDSASGNSIERKMLDKVKELEKTNLETLLKTYKGGLTRPNQETQERTQRPNPGNRGTQKGSWAHAHEFRGPSRPGKSAQAKNCGPQKLELALEIPSKVEVEVIEGASRKRLQKSRVSVGGNPTLGKADPSERKEGVYQRHRIHDPQLQVQPQPPPKVHQGQFLSPINRANYPASLPGPFDDVVQAP